MAGSRREAIGSILTRIEGLLRSGAMKVEDRPIWYPVVKAFPPKPTPPPREVQKILYPEDYIRVNFYKTYADPGSTNLANEKVKSIPQKFVSKYLELHTLGTDPPDGLFDETVRVLREEGIKLITHEELKVARQAKYATSKQRTSYPKSPTEERKTAIQPTQTTPAATTTHENKEKTQKLIDDLFKEQT